MKSSYIENSYNHLISSLIAVHKPRRIAEFGILQGYSLEAIISSAGKDAEVEAYDIFDEFSYSSADRAHLEKKFGDIIKYGDFWKKCFALKDRSYDLIHIDIANDGDVYEFALDNYMQKLKYGGIMLLEGGSEERDQLEWMEKYNKRKIRPVLQDSEYPNFTFSPFPSMTIIKR